MPEGIIDMTDMAAIFAITDVFGIHRESVRVELAKEDPGSIGRGSGGLIEITIPETGTVQAFAQRLQHELEGMGYLPQEPGENDDEDD